MSRFIGHSFRRREDRPLLLGHGQYAADVALPGCLHMAVLRSPHPHAGIARINSDRARMPGVVGVFTAADLFEVQNNLADPIPAGLEAIPRPLLADDRVRYVGEAIAVVVAEDAARAADAVGAIEVDFDPRPGVGDVRAATQPEAPRVHAGLESNIAGRIERAFGDITTAFSSDALIVRQTFTLGRVIGGYLEPRASAARFDAEAEMLTVWTSTQWVYGVRDRIALLLGLDKSQVRVLAPDVGGGFGAKGMVYAEEILVAALARRLRRPVRWVATRTEDTQSTAHSHGDVAEAELAANPDGTLRGLRVRLRHDVGAYAGPGMGQSDNILAHLISAYRLPALQAESSIVYTNAVPTGFIRGGGREVGNFVIERMMDQLARTVGIDPAEVRRRNLIGLSDMPYSTGYLRLGTRPVVYDGGDYARLLEDALQAIGYDAARRKQAAGGHIGVGIACCVESAGIQQPEPATVRVLPGGDVQAYLGSTPGGQGHRTTFAQVIAEHLEWPIERVQVFVGDTTTVSSSANTAGSRSALEVGNAAAMAARAARGQLVERAQSALEVASDDLVIGPSGVEVRGAPGQRVELAQLLNGARWLEGQDTFQSEGAYTSAVHAVTVELDPDTATVHVLDYVIAHDCGQPINPLLVHGQLHGGVVHGLGYALMEEAVYLPDGTLTTANFLDYTLPSRGIPMALQAQLLDYQAPVFGKNPEGFKGVGETGTIAVPAAVAGAIEDALRSMGVDTRIATLPLTPRRVFELLTPAADGA